MATVSDIDDAERRPCQRCLANPSCVVVRHDKLCRECFLKYVNTKVVKRMENFRVRHAPGGGAAARTLLLPMSFGTSSVALLQILSEHIKGQCRKTGRAGYALSVVHVIATGMSAAESAQRIERLRNRYPHHSFAVIPLSQPSCTQPGVESPTSVADSHALAVRNTLLDHAKSTSCAGIVWSETTTSLAERVLAETAKGRGGSIPFLLGDGTADRDAGGTPSYFPLKDLLRKEVLPFVELMDVQDLVRQSSRTETLETSKKKTTIDGLMAAYFRTVEDNFPSIVANVVRTAEKLRAPSGSREWRSCLLCRTPFDSTQAGGVTMEISDFATHCYGCRQAGLAAG